MTCPDFVCVWEGCGCRGNGGPLSKKQFSWRLSPHSRSGASTAENGSDRECFFRINKNTGDSGDILHSRRRDVKPTVFCQLDDFLGESAARHNGCVVQDEPLY